MFKITILRLLKTFLRFPGKWGCMACLVFIFAEGANAQSSTSLEYKVKAAYLLNFTRYVKWPDNESGRNDSSIVIAVLGKDPFGAVLEKTVAGRTSHGKSVQVRRYERPDQVKGCHLIFISKKEKKRQAKFLAGLKGERALTVGESDRFIQHGGIINLVIVQEAVRFEINLEAAEKAGIQISSRILNLAEAVYPERQEEK